MDKNPKPKKSDEMEEKDDRFRVIKLVYGFGTMETKITTTTKKS